MALIVNQITDKKESSIDNLSGNQLLACAVLEIKRIGKAGIVSVEEPHTGPQNSSAEIQV